MIFYFSGTGNTRWAAQQLAERTDEQLVFIPDVIDSDCRFALQANERLGFVFPVHGWRPPKLVRNFIKKLTISQAEETDSTHYTYMLCTAGDSIGRTKEIFEQDLAGRGLTLHAAFSILMPESYVGLPMMDVDTEPKEIAKLHQAWDDICLYATHIYNKVETEHLTRGPLPWFFSGPVGSYFVNRLVTDKKFHVNTDTCIKCGRCAEVCPVKDIEGGKGKTPTWIHNGKCLTCFACYHHCPTHAIEFGKRTLHKGQYYLTEERMNNVKP